MGPFLFHSKIVLPFPIFTDVPYVRTFLGPRCLHFPGPKDQRTKGPKDQPTLFASSWTKGPKDERIRELKDQRIKGPKDQRISPHCLHLPGPKDQRTKEPKDQRTSPRCLHLPGPKRFVSLNVAWCRLCWGIYLRSHTPLASKRVGVPMGV